MLAVILVICGPYLLGIWIQGQFLHTAPLRTWQFYLLIKGALFDAGKVAGSTKCEESKIKSFVCLGIKNNDLYLLIKSPSQKNAWCSFKFRFWLFLARKYCCWKLLFFCGLFVDNTFALKQWHRGVIKYYKLLGYCGHIVVIILVSWLDQCKSLGGRGGWGEGWTDDVRSAPCRFGVAGGGGWPGNKPDE